jgi:hypothetical protein
MPKERKKPVPDNAADLTKKPKMFRLTPPTIRRLKEATIQAGRSESVYVEDALKAQFKKDGIT